MSNLMHELPLAITCGDPAGIGPEVIEKSIRGDNCKDYVVIGPRTWCESMSSAIGVKSAVVGPDNYIAKPGSPSIQSAEVAVDALREAANGCVEGRFRGVVSGPVSKYWLQRFGFDYTGQTEFFGDVWGGFPTMGFVGKSLRVVLATWHLPLAEVPRALTAKVLARAVTQANILAKRLGTQSPRIGVCGLNPHAGEGGLLGNEEKDILDPELDRLRIQIPGLSQCLPGDTAFLRQHNGEFDIVVAAYHDQALAAVKTFEFSTAVNVTLGLNYVRTSPDHGTAFQIAEKNKADPSSFTSALKLARELTKRK